MRVSERGDSPQRTQSTLRGRSGGEEERGIQHKGTRAQRIQSSEKIPCFVSANHKLQVTNHSLSVRTLPLLLLFFLRPGMKFEIDLLQPFHADVGIDFRSGDGRMAQHHLDCPKIRPMFQKVGGEGVTQGVWRELVGDTDFPAVSFQDFPESLAGQGVSKPVEKEYIAFLPVQCADPAVIQIVFHPVPCGVSEWYQAFLCPFPKGDEEAFRHVQVVDFQVDEFRYPKAGGIEKLNHSLVPLSEWRLHIRQ